MCGSGLPLDGSQMRDTLESGEGHTGPLGFRGQGHVEVRRVESNGSDSDCGFGVCAGAGGG